MRTPFVAGNWKMNGNQAMALGLCRELVDGATGLDNVDIVLCPPAILLSVVSSAVHDSRIHTGAQDVDVHESGAYTGQTAASMVKDAGADYAIVGHSERRSYHGETDEIVATKFNTALAGALTPIACVGETQQQREDDQTEAVIKQQVSTLIEHCGIAAFEHAVIAYEPVWAIGTGLTASPEQAQEVHHFIRNLLAQHDGAIASVCRIIYGGSMKPENAANLMAQQDIDGGLIGGASLNSQDFLAICQAAA